MLGPAQETGLWGPHTGKRAIHHTGGVWGAGAALPQEAGAGPLKSPKSPIEQFIPQMQGLELGRGVGSSCPLVLYFQGLGLVMGTHGQGAQ